MLARNTYCSTDLPPSDGSKMESEGVEVKLAVGGL